MLLSELLRGAFSSFGQILEIRVFKEKGYGFIRFGDKASACKAICEMHNKEVSGHPCKCAWGRESTGKPIVTVLMVAYAFSLSLSPLRRSLAHNRKKIKLH